MLVAKSASGLAPGILTACAYIPTGEGWLYMAAIMDLHTRKIVGWSMRDHLRAELATSALMMAVQRQRPGPGLIQLILHDFRGSPALCVEAKGREGRLDLYRPGCAKPQWRM